MGISPMAKSTEAPSLVEFWGQRVAEFSRRQAESLLIAAQASDDGAKMAWQVRWP